MSKRVDVLTAVKRLIEDALPHTVVRGMDADDAKPTAVGALGMVIVRSGDPGDPEIDLSPPTYWWEHNIPVEIAAYQSSSKTAQETLDEMLMAIGAAIEADRTLGGLCLYLDAQAATDGETEIRGATAIGWADFAIIASYATNTPLS